VKKNSKFITIKKFNMKTSISTKQNTSQTSACKTKKNALTAQSSLTLYKLQLFTQRSTALLLLLLSMWLLSGAEAQAQNNVGIGTTTPNSKAILELQAVDKGFLAPRLTQAQMSAIATPPNGLLVYNTTANCFYYYNAITLSWKSMCNISSNAHDTLVLNLVQIDSLFSHYIKTDSLLSHTIITNYLKADSAYIKNLVSQYITAIYIKTDSIKAHFGRFDSIYINGQNLNQYINSQLSSKDTVVLKYLRTDSIFSVLIKADSAFIKSILTNTLTAHYITTDSIYAHLGRFDSLYVGGKNISQIISDSIAAQAWLLKGNNAAVNNKLGTLNAQNLHIVTGGTDKITILNGTGNVGIGQTLPNAKLDVLGDVQFTKELKPAGNAGVTGQVLTSAGAGLAPTWTVPAPPTTTVSNTYNAVTGALNTTVNGVTGANVTLPTNQAVTDSIKSLAWTLKGNVGTTAGTNFIGTTDAQDLVLKTNGVENMRIINSNGNLGIGTSTPITKLDVNGNTRITGNSDYTQPLSTSYDLSLETAITNRRFLFGGNGASYSLQSTEFFSGNTYDMALNPLGGNVAVGIINPTALLHVQKNINSAITPGNFYITKSELFNNSTITAAGNVAANEGKVINNASGTIKTAGASLLAGEFSVNNDGTIANTQNTFGTYNRITNNGTYTVTGSTTAGWNEVTNIAGKTLNSPATDGLVGTVNNLGTLNGTNSFGIFSDFQNSGTANLSTEVAGGYFRVVNNAGATLNTNYTRGIVGVNIINGTLTGNYISGIDGGTEFQPGAVINVTSEAKGASFYIINTAGATANVPYSKGMQSRISNYSAYTGIGMWAQESYVDNSANITLNSGGGLRGTTVNISNQATGTISASTILSGEHLINNAGGIMTASSQITAGAVQLYNTGTINSPVIRGGYFNVENALGGNMPLVQNIIATGSYLTNRNTVNTKYSYVTDIGFYNKGNFHTGHHRGLQMYNTNDTAGVILADSTYIGGLVESNNYGTLTTNTQRGFITTLQNTASSTANVVNMIGNETNVYHRGIGNITNAYGLVTGIYKPVGSPGNITNSYGLVINGIEGTNKFGLYQNDGNAKNYFAGNVGIGTATPTEKLEINGSLKITDGTQAAGKVLKSDAFGKASWSTLAPQAVVGTVPVANVTWTTDNLYHYMGYSVVVPPGRSTVSVGVFVGSSASLGYFTARLSTSNTVQTFAGTNVLPGLCAVTANPTFNYAIGTLLYYVENTTGSPLTVYVWGIAANATVGATFTVGGSSGYAEPYILTAY
jgi:hypothetical protein